MGEEYIDSSDNIRVCLKTWKEFGDVRPHVLFLHATGFSKESWMPTIEELRGLEVKNALSAIDVRGHGNTYMPGPPFEYRSWQACGDDVEAAVRHLRSVYGASVPLVGVGLSSGAAALAMCETRTPGTFSSLVLIEPIICQHPGQLVARYEESPLAAGAEKRRTTWKSLEEAEQYFAGKSLAAKWDKRSLQAYTRGILRLDPQTSQWTLKCHPKAEAEQYRTGFAHNTFAELPNVKCPVTVVAGTESNTYTIEPATGLASGMMSLSTLASQFKNSVSVTSIHVQGAGHIVNLDQPRTVAQIIQKALQHPFLRHRL